MNAEIHKTVRDQVLEWLIDKPPLSIADIATGLQKEPNNLHRIVKDLQDCGLVIGEMAPPPRRCMVYSLMGDDSLIGAPRLIPVITPPAQPAVATENVTALPARRQEPLSTDDFMRTIERLRRDSDILNRIRELLAETA